MTEKVYEPGQHLIYTEDGAVLLVEVLENRSDLEFESYRLRIRCQLKRSGFTMKDGEGRAIYFEPSLTQQRDFTFSKRKGLSGMLLGEITGEAPKELVDQVRALSN